MSGETAVPTAWPLVGRADELDQVLAALTQARGAVLSGAAGVGKSRLAAEAVTRVVADGWVQVSATAGPETVSAPFSPFAALLDDDVAADALGLILRATRSLVGRGDRVVLSVDDAHLLDEVSVAFLRHLVTATDVRLLLTVRTGSPASPSVTDLWQSGKMARLELFPLARAETLGLLRLVLPGEVGPQAVDWVWTTTRGNPLFVHELVLDAVERGAFVQREGRWTVDTSAGVAGARLQEVVAARVGSLSPEERVAVELLALAEPLGLSKLESLTDPVVVAALADRGLLAPATERRRTVVRLAHPLHGEVVRSTMTVTANRDRRRALVEAFTATGLRRRSDAVRVALWRSQLGDVDDWASLLAAAEDLAGTVDRAFLAGLEGAEPSAAPGYLEQAVVLARAALDGGGSVRAASVLVRLLTLLGRHDEAEQVHDEVRRATGGGFDELALVRMRAGVALFDDGDSGSARELLRRFVEQVDDPDLRAGAQATLALVTSLTGAPAEALAMARPLLETGGGTPEDRLAGMAAVSVSLGEAGQLQEGLALVDAAFAGVTGREGSGLVVWLSLVRGMLLAADGQLAPAEALARSCYEAAAASRDSSTMGLFSALVAHVALERGHAARAGASAREAIERLGERDAFGAGRIAMALRLHAAALLGADGEADLAAKALDVLAPPIPPSQEHRARAWIDVATGRLSIAAARLQATAESQARSGHVVREAAALHDLVRLGHARAAAERLREIAGRCDSAAVSAMAAHATAAASGDGAGLADVAERWEAMSFDLFAAEAFAQAAVSLERSGRRDEGAKLRVRSEAAADRCGAITTPALHVEGPLSTLTRRELEVATLAARGMTDRQIADELVLSVRTVQTHLYNVYAKLGVEGRVGLASVIGH